MTQNQAGQAVPRCSVCNRPLRSAEAIKNGMGHECAKRYSQQVTSTPEFQNFLASHGMSVETFKKLEESKQNSENDAYYRVLTSYQEEVKQLENPLPTFERFVQEKGVDPSYILNPQQENLDEPTNSQKRELFQQLTKQYREEVVYAFAKNYTPLYPSQADYPVTVNYVHLSNKQVDVEHVEFDGFQKEIRVYTRIKPDYHEINHHDFNEMVTFSKDKNGETIATIETIGVQGGDIIKEIRNPKYDPNNPYQQHLYQIQGDFEAQVGASPDIPPEPKDLNSVFQHAYDCDYPLVADKYKKYGVDIRSVRYYDKVEDTPWTNHYRGGVMVVKLNDQKDGDAEIRYDIKDGKVVTNIKQGDTIMNFPEGSKDWLYHPTHLKYYQLLKETQRDYKEMNQENLRRSLENNLEFYHRHLQSLNRIGNLTPNNQLWKEKYQNEIAKATVELQALTNKQDPNVEQLRQLNKKEEEIKIGMFKENWNSETNKVKRIYENYFEGETSSPAINKIGEYFKTKQARFQMKRAGIL